ncbi:Initiation factor 2B-related [Trinorchestia longiramus]|nr:Initiation factor 2B-related [Trinorchestia longiramus]
MKYVRDALTNCDCASVVAVSTGEMFTRFITRANFALEDADTFAEARAILVSRGNDFLQTSLAAPERVARKALQLFHTETYEPFSVLTHSRSVCALKTFIEARQKGHIFRVYVTEGRPLNQGPSMVEELTKAGVCCNSVPDSAMAFCMERCRMVMVGVEAVCPNGGIIAQIGTATMTSVAKRFNRPVYAILEFYRFSEHHFPLNNSLLVSKHCPGLKPGECPGIDYTPPEYITRLVTDIGTLDPLYAPDTVNHLFT